MQKSVQEEFAPQSICFGCGPANAQGLRIRSMRDGDGLVATWKPQAHHEAFPGVLNGGIIGSLLDCHCNWAAAMALMVSSGSTVPPCTVTADYTIALKRPCPTNVELTLKARAAQVRGDRCIVDGELFADGKLRATCRGTFVAVGPGHPAYHRW